MLGLIKYPAILRTSVEKRSCNTLSSTSTLKQSFTTSSNHMLTIQMYEYKLILTTQSIPDLTRWNVKTSLR